MSFNFSFSYSDYATLKFIQQGEENVESLVPRRQLIHFHKIVKQIDDSHDFSAIIEDIAESTFTDLINFLNHKEDNYDETRLQLMIEAAKKLELPELEAKLTKIFAQSQKKTIRTND